MGVMSGEEVKESEIEKFDGTDFGYWRMQIEDYLYGKKLHFPIEFESIPNNWYQSHLNM